MLAAMMATRPAVADVNIALDPTRTYQTFQHWEATVNLLYEQRLEPYKEEILDRLIDDIGITRLRVGVFAGAEAPSNAFSEFIAGKIDMKGWQARRYATVNDNDDPFVANPAGFDFADLDWKIQTLVIPLLSRARARGVPMSVNLNYVAFTDQTRGGDYHHDDPEEYAEFMLQAFRHLNTNYGIVPEWLELVLEPDTVKEWSPALLGAAAAAVTRRLTAEGFGPRLIGPSVMDARNAVPWFEGIAKTPGAMNLMSELSYHRYKGGSKPALQAIADRAAVAGLRTGMLEYFNGRGRYPALHSDLAVGNVSVWHGRAVMGYFNVFAQRPAGERVVVPDDVRYNLEYMRSIRPGAQRIAAVSSDPKAVDPVAFINIGNAWSVVMMAAGRDRVIIEGLPAGNYFVSWAVDEGSTEFLDPVRVGADGLLLAEIPGKGVLAVTAIPRD